MMGQECLPPLMVMAQVSKGPPFQKKLFRTPATPVRFKYKQTYKERKQTNKQINKTQKKSANIKPTNKQTTNEQTIYFFE